MIGFRILERKRKVADLVVRQFRDIPVANISDSMSRITAGGARLRPMHGGGVMAGPAFTVKTRPGDNLMVHKALDLAEPGDVIVVDAGGDLTNAIIGEIMSTYAKARRVAGIVINGAIRDADSLRAGVPGVRRRRNPSGPYKDGPGEINVPVAIDGMVIEPGDLAVGDGDGILCVPFDATDAVYALASEKVEARDARTRSGRQRGAGSRLGRCPAPTARIEGSLGATNCPPNGETPETAPKRWSKR